MGARSAADLALDLPRPGRVLRQLLAVLALVSVATDDGTG